MSHKEVHEETDVGLGGYVRSVTGRKPKGRDPKTAFVLAGGGVLGALQVGHLEALIGAGIKPDFLVGASVGALNAAAIAYDPTPQGVARLSDIWSSLRSEDIFPGSRLQRAWHFVRKGDHLYSNSGIRGLIARVPCRTFEQMQLPLSVVAANLRTGSEHWFERGAIEPALLASTALPSIFPPVCVDGELLVDGGVVNNVPISRAVELGATRIYVLHCGVKRAAGREIRRPIDVLMQAVAHSRGVRAELDMTRYASHADITVLPVFDPGRLRFDDPTQSKQIIARARSMTEDFLGVRAAV